MQPVRNLNIDYKVLIENYYWYLNTPDIEQKPRPYTTVLFIAENTIFIGYMEKRYNKELKINIYEWSASVNYGITKSKNIVPFSFNTFKDSDITYWAPIPNKPINTIKNNSKK